MKTVNKQKLVGEGYLFPFLLLTSLFFLWGFARAILDVLNKHCQELFHVDKTQSALIQFMIYGAYFLIAIPSGWIIRKYGTRRGLTVGLLVFGIGALLFVPSLYMPHTYVFYYFLVPLFIIGSGLVCLETGANPYITLLGAPDTAAGRLNRAQAFNGVGSMCGSIFGGLFFFSGMEVSKGATGIVVPYVIIGVVVLLVAFLFSRVKLPEVVVDTEQAATTNMDGGKSIWKKPEFVFGVLALFMYEIAEISINSFFINYVTAGGEFNNMQATYFLSFGGLALFMVGRFVGSGIMRRIPAEKILLVCSTGTSLTSLAAIVDLGLFSIIAVIIGYVFESIMFPTIFALALKYAGRQTEYASSVLMLSVLGGAVGPLLMGLVADMTGNMALSFIVPFVGFAVTWFYARLMCKKR